MLKERCEMQEAKSISMDMDFLKKKLSDRLMPGVILPVPDKPKSIK